MSLLNDEAYLEFIKTELQLCVDVNTHPDTSLVLLWDCTKAYLWGHIISYATAKKMRNNEMRVELKVKIKQLEQQHKAQPTAVLLTELREVHRALDSLLSNKIEGQLRFAKQRYYEHGSRASILLAFQVRKQQESNVVQKLKSLKPNQFLTKLYNIFQRLLLIFIRHYIQIVVQAL